jgi:hypothetical protein
MIELTRTVIPRMKAAEWDSILQALLNQAEVINVTIDESNLGVIYEIINTASLKNESENPLNGLNWSAILLDGFVYVKMDTIQKILFDYKMQLLARSRQRIGYYLRKIGFKKSDYRIQGAQVGKIWRMPLDDFKKFGDQN